MTIRIALTVLTLFLLSVLAGCGAQTGPSADEVQLDLQDLFNKKYQGMVQLQDFTVLDRHVVSESRVKFRVQASIGLNKERVAQFKQGVKTSNGTITETGLFGFNHYRAARDAEKLVHRNHGKPDQITLLYRKNGHGMWQLAGLGS